MGAYLDHNAATPLLPEARAAMLDRLREGFGNPSSVHREGQRARLAVEDARARVAALLCSEPSEVVFTASGTEADNLALRGVLDGRLGAHLVTTGLEHEAVRECARLMEGRGHPVTTVPPGPAGVVDANRVLDALRPDTALVSIILASNLIGTLQPVEAVAAGCRERGVACHTDAVQVAGRAPLSFRDLGVDLMSVSSHKMGGPPGAGALVVRRGLELLPLLSGGGQEFRRRSGTENVPALAGFGAAAEAAVGRLGAWAGAGPKRDRFEEGLLRAVPGARVLGREAPRLANTTAVLFPGRRADDLVIALDLMGYAVSAGAACHGGAPEPDEALLSLGLGHEAAASVLRVSLGPATDSLEVDGLLEALAGLVAAPTGAS